MVVDINSMVVGYVSYRPGGGVLCVGEEPAPYTFDRLAYRRFYPLAQKAEKPWHLPHPNTIRLELVYVGILNEIPA